MVNTRRLDDDEHTSLLPTQRDGLYSEKYILTNDIHDSTTTFPLTPRYIKSNRLRTGLLVVLASFILLFSKYLVVSLYRDSITNTSPHNLPTSTRPIVDSDDYDSGAPFAPLKVQRQWASYAPYYSVERYQPPPKDCQLTQVNILQRHAARYPTTGQAANIVQAVRKLQAAESYIDKRLRFIADYEYDLGIDDMLPYGGIQAVESGRKAFVRYPMLVNKTNLPFVRASGSQRVIDSALKWIEGFIAGTKGALQPPLAVIIPETKGSNNTLEDKSCPKVNHTSAESEEWQNIYAQPIADRLNSAAHCLPEDLNPEDAEALITLCALETIAKQKYSRFCRLFTQEDFEGFEYSFDLDKFYYTGHGSRFGAVQGVGYINELLARLTHLPVHDHTQTNTTLDSNPKTFPLDRGMYIDLSHDNLMVAVVSTMGLFKDEENGGDGGMLDPKHPKKKRDWYLSRIVPFSARLVVERMECGLPVGKEEGEMEQVRIGVTGERKRRRDRQRRREEDPEGSVYVRILMSDAVQDLEFCEDVDEDGLCPLQAFVESQYYARKSGRGDWEKCFEKLQP